MLKRIITGLVLAAVCIPVLYYSDTVVFPIGIALFSLIGSIEMMRCIGMSKKYALTAPLYAASLALPFLIRYSPENIKFAIYFLLIYILYLFSMAVFSHGKIKTGEISTLFFTGLYVNVGFASLIILRDYETVGKYIYLLALLGAWMSDIFAYFCGMAFGKHKLIPDVSPKKTVEGSVGGIVFCALSYLIYGLVLNNHFALEFNLVALTLFGIVISIVSQIGDLAASVIKREYGVKDYGRIFPGHGGVIDRFDSILAVSIVLTVLFYSVKIV